VRKAGDVVEWSWNLNIISGSATSFLYDWERNLPGRGWFRYLWLDKQITGMNVTMVRS
jgi:hypothetical protein